MSVIHTILRWLGLGGRRLSPEAFTALYARRVRQHLPSSEIQIVEPLQLKIMLAGGKSLQSFLANAYDMYLANPAEVEEVIMSRVAAFREVMEMENHQIDVERIVGVVKDAAWASEVARAAAHSQEPPKEQVIDILNEHLIIAYAEDTPTSMHFLTAETLAETGLKREDLRFRAGENLLDLLPPPEMHQGKGYYLVTAGGDYEASLLGVNRFWTKDRFPLEGDLIAAVPTRDVLLVTATGEPEGLAKVRELVNDIYAQGSYRLTQKLFIIRDGHVLPLE